MSMDAVPQVRNDLARTGNGELGEISSSSLLNSQFSILNSPTIWTDKGELV